MTSTRAREWTQENKRHLKVQETDAGVVNLTPSHRVRARELVWSLLPTAQSPSHRVRAREQLMREIFPTLTPAHRVRAREMTV